MSYFKENRLKKCAALSFLLPLSAVLTAYIYNAIAPFGEKSVLIADMSQQYIDFLAYFRSAVFGGESLMYTWRSGMGVNFFGIFAYYLASPFNIIVLLFPKKFVVEAAAVIIALKIASAGLTFSLLMRRMRKSAAYIDVVFAVMYALMSYNIVNSFNIMWLDGVILLPLALIGLEKLIFDGRKILFISSLALMFITNYYISYMAGIFIFLWLIFRLTGEKKSGCVKITVSFFACVVTAALLAGFVLVPAYCAVSASGEMQLSAAAGGIQTRFSVLAKKLLVGSFDSVTGNGTANIYCGILCSVLVVFYFFSDARRREKVAAALMLVFYAASMTVWELSTAWHAFHSPNWYNYRFTFTFCCFALLLAQRGLMEIPSIGGRKIFIPSSLACIMVAAVSLGSDRFGTISLILALIYTVCILLFNSHRKTVCAVMAAAVLFEMVLNTCVVLKKLDTVPPEGIESAESYRRTARINADMTAAMPKSGFYRAESMSLRYPNDSLSGGYNGIGHYSSVANPCELRFFRLMGLRCDEFDGYAKYFGATSMLDDIFGVRYIANGGFSNYPAVAETENMRLSENTDALGIMFAASEDIVPMSAYKSDPFTIQNKYISAVGGMKTELFKHVDGASVTYSGMTENDGNLTVTGDSPSVNISFACPKAGEVYLWFDSDFPEKTPVFVNGEPANNGVEVLNATVYLGRFEKDSVVNVTVPLVSGYSAKVKEIVPAVLDTGMLSVCTAALSETSKNIKVKNCRAEGEVTLGENSVIYTTIPYDGGWSAKIDGKKAEILRTGSSFMAVRAEAGTHKVEFSFTPPGLKSGAALTIAGILIFVYIVLKEKKK